MSVRDKDVHRVRYLERAGFVHRLDAKQLRSVSHDVTVAQVDRMR